VHPHLWWFRAHKKSITSSASICLPLRRHTIMAARLLPLQSILHLFQPVQTLRQPALSAPFIQRILSPTLPLSLPLAAFAGVSDILREIWDGLLRAVPKKKTSHMKKRHRQMAGKALKDVTHLSKCSACGRLKRAHVLCPYCVEGMFMWSH
jgi:large subunit ribosomal protein L32